MKIKDWMKLGVGAWIAMNMYTFLMTCEDMLLDRSLNKLNKKDSKPENEEES
jgi:hypothetical protein